MQKRFRILIFILVLLFTIIGFSLDVKPIQEAKIVLSDDGLSGEDYFINIKKSGIVEYISFEVGTFNFQSKEIEGEIYNRRLVYLFDNNRNVVNELVEKTTYDEPAERINGSGFVEIIALIDGEKYYSVYGNYGCSMKRFYNENLAQLCYKLVDIIPFISRDSRLLLPDEYK